MVVAAVSNEMLSALPTLCLRRLRARVRIRAGRRHHAGADADPERWSVEIATFTAIVMHERELREVFNGNNW